MGRLLRLGVIAAVAWAAWHAGLAAWQQFQFADEVGKVAQFGPDRDEESVREAVLEVAARLDLPVTGTNVRIRRQDRPASLYIDVTYTTRIQILPSYYYPWTFNTSAHGWFVPGGRAPLK
jgi:hypothetical protein